MGSQLQFLGSWPTGAVFLCDDNDQFTQLHYESSVMHPTLQKMIESASPRAADREALRESPMGLFHAFRPDGLKDAGIVEDVDGGEPFRSRLNQVFASVGEGHRSDGMKDAYFIVRHPSVCPEERAEHLARGFVDAALRIAAACDAAGAFSLLREQADAIGTPNVRLLEGKPPKHPRRPEEQVALMKLLTKGIPKVLDDAFAEGSLGHALAEPLYFLACDEWLREYVRSPLIDKPCLPSGCSTTRPQRLPETLAENGPTSDRELAVAAYFGLWRHGIKFRVFGNEQVDFYLPRRTDGSLINAGQFAHRRF